MKLTRIISIIAISICFIACNSNKARNLIAATDAVQIDNAPGECPYLTKDNKGNTVLSWIRMLNDSTTAFCYATSSDGKTFSSPFVIPNSDKIQPHGENLPKIIFKPSGEIIALWGSANPTPRNKYSGLVFYTQSFDNGKTWTNVRSLVNDTASYDQRYYDVAILPNGEAGIIWLDNRKTISKQGSALFFASTNGKDGFDNGRLISQLCCQCCRTKIYVGSRGEIHALYRGIEQDSIRDMEHIVSTDGGKTFTKPKKISDDNWALNACPHTGPSMTENSQGIHFAWYTGAGHKGCYYTKSNDNGKSFVMHDSVSSYGSHPQLTSLTNGKLLIVWDESTIVNNKPNRRIGIESRSADGRAEGQDFITPENSNASYPVIVPTNDNNSIIAYSTKKDGKDFITYQVVTVK